MMKIKNKKIKKTITILPLFFLISCFIFIIHIPTTVQADAIKIHELTIPILTYHKFCTGESPDAYTIDVILFEKQLEHLKKNGYEVLSVSQLLKCMDNNCFPEKPVVITIDDGFKSVYTHAFPLLKKYHFPATLYLYTDFIAHGPKQLSWQEIREMAEHGLEVGSHTLSHCNLLQIKENESQTDYFKRIKKEIELSKVILEKNTASEVISFAYPYGLYSQQIQSLAKQAGYQALLNVNNMNNAIPMDAYSLNRQVVPAGCSMKLFENFLGEKILRVAQIFPADGTLTDKQDIKIGVILDNANIEAKDSFYFKLTGGSNLLDYTYNSQLQEISFTPIAPKLLQKRTWVPQITAYDKNTGEKRKVSWLFTVK